MAVAFEKFATGRGDFRITADWALAPGETLALIGPSGAGKSIFLNAIAGFETVFGGRVLIDGADVTTTAPADRPVTMMFQDHNLFPHLTVHQNVGLGLDPGLKLSSEDRDRVAQALRDVDLGALAGRYPTELSGGQQSRVALARALIRARPLLLLDEPFAALGPGLRRDMLSLVMEARAAAAMSLIYVTHTPQDARMAPMTAFIRDGVIAAPVPTAQLFDDPPPALRDYL